MRLLRLGGSGLLAAIGLASPKVSHSQIAGSPVFYSPSAEAGVRVSGDFAFPVFGGHGGIFYGGRALLNLSYMSIGLAVGRRPHSDLSWSGSASLNLVRGSSRRYSLSLESGYGRSVVGADPDETRIRDIPLGAAVALEVSRAGLDVEPWVGARVHTRRTAFQGDAETRTGVGMSAGVNLGVDAATKIHLPGLGLHVAVDYLRLPGVFGGARVSELKVGVGVNYQFNFWGMPLHGIIRPKCADPTRPRC